MGVHITAEACAGHRATAAKLRARAAWSRATFCVQCRFLERRLSMRRRSCAEDRHRRCARAAPRAVRAKRRAPCMALATRRGDGRAAHVVRGASSAREAAAVLECRRGHLAPPFRDAGDATSCRRRTPHAASKQKRAASRRARSRRRKSALWRSMATSGPRAAASAPASLDDSGDAARASELTRHATKMLDAYFARAPRRPDPRADVVYVRLCRCCGWCPSSWCSTPRRWRRTTSDTTVIPISDLVRCDVRPAATGARALQVSGPSRHAACCACDDATDARAARGRSSSSDQPKAGAAVAAPRAEQVRRDRGRVARGRARRSDARAGQAARLFGRVDDRISSGAPGGAPVDGARWAKPRSGRRSLELPVKVEFATTPKGRPGASRPPLHGHATPPNTRTKSARPRRGPSPRPRGPARTPRRGTRSVFQRRAALSNSAMHSRPIGIVREQEHRRGIVVCVEHREDAARARRPTAGRTWAVWHIMSRSRPV